MSCWTDPPREARAFSRLFELSRQIDDLRPAVGRD